MFTDLAAAIDEARFLRADTGRHHCITQRPGGVMYVRQERNPRREIGLKKLYTTRQDRFGTVNTDGGYEVQGEKFDITLSPLGEK